MAFTPLTKDQYQKAVTSGFTPDQIIQFEKQRKASDVNTGGMLEISKPTGGLLNKIPYIGGVLGGISNVGVGIGSTIGKAGIGLGQLLTKASGKVAGMMGMPDVQKKYENLTQTQEQVKQNIFQKQ